MDGKGGCEAPYTFAVARRYDGRTSQRKCGLFEYRPRHGIAFRNQPADARQHTLRCLRPTTDRHALHADQPISRDPRSSSIFSVRRGTPAGYLSSRLEWRPFLQRRSFRRKFCTERWRFDKRFPFIPNQYQRCECDLFELLYVGILFVQHTTE